MMDGWGHGPLPVPFGYGGGLPSPSYSQCPGCGLLEAEIANSTNVGCQLCYTTFPSLVSSIIWRFQGSTVHHGQVPSSADLRFEARSVTYQEALQKAENEGRTEDVSILTDLLRLLKPEDN
jgi:protein-arginine kinase activator protein McsA